MTTRRLKPKRDVAPPNEILEDAQQEILTARGAGGSLAERRQKIAAAFLRIRDAGLHGYPLPSELWSHVFGRQATRSDIERLAAGETVPGFVS